MRDAAGQPADGFEPLRLANLVGPQPLLRDIAKHQHNARDVAVVVSHRGRAVVD